jgi:hypothetical protein
VTVGLSARQGIEVMASDPQDKACVMAVAVAERVVRNLAGEG